MFVIEFTYLTEIMLQVELLPMHEAEVHSKHFVQRMNVGQPVPQPTAILPREVCNTAISDIDMRVEGEEGNTVYLARWDEFGYATVDQLSTMVMVIDARKAMETVKETLDWIEKTDLPKSVAQPPFDDCVSFPKVRSIWYQINVYCTEVRYEILIFDTGHAVVI